MHFLRRSTRLLALLLAFIAIPSWADVELRVEARPIADPIQVFVTVTDGGVPVANLTSADFTVTLDGAAVQLNPLDLTQPPSQDPDNRVSVVFVMDYTSSVTDQFLAVMQDSVLTFIDDMSPGDYAAIIKFNNTTGASVVQAFVEIDQGPNNQLLADAVLADYPGDGSNILDATNVAIEHFAAQLGSLPSGPKAIILVTDGIDSHSTSTPGEVIGSANENSIPIFIVGIGDPTQGAINLMTDLATDTGGELVLAPTEQEITDAYASISLLLSSEYLISIPSAISDCAVHTLEVAVAGQATPASATFTRRACDTAPNAFSFTSQSGVALNTPITSNTVTISGIEVPAAISITIGSYSVGCSGTFTNQPGTISNNQTVCIRQTSSQSFSTSRVSTLTVGGVSATFTTTTRAEGNGGGGGGGGGATGALEMLLGLAALFARRRRLA